jgi:hypothetical protein
MNIGPGMIIITQFSPYTPVPVGTKAITPAIPDAQHKPGEGGEQHCYQMQLSCFGENPAHHIEYSKCRVKNKEENIEKPVPHRAELK